MNNPTLNLKLGTLNRRRGRPAVTIIEVLFAILVTSVGLLGAIALFPVASAQARRARLNDMLGLAGRSAFHDFDTRGMRRPDRWLAWDPNVAPAGSFVPYLSVSNLNLAWGESLCIDPRMIASHTSTNTTTGVQSLAAATSASGSAGGQCVQSFPYAAVGTTPFLIPATPMTPQRWNTQYMRRITLRAASGAALGMRLPQADAIFRIEDDISYTRPENGGPNGATRSDSATQNATLLPTGATNSWGRRSSDGKITWLATIAPIFDISGVPSDEYTLSVVMLHDRPSRLDRIDNMMERTVTGTFQSAGETGGEIRLTSTSAEQLQLKSNDWVMVSGTYNVSQTTAGPFVTRFQWYRIAECDLEPELITIGPATGNFQLYATLIGQDWNMNFANPLTTTPTGNVSVTIVQGAFAVYEKTIRLEYGSTF